MRWPPASTTAADTSAPTSAACSMAAAVIRAARAREITGTLWQ
jgi:hypothetical protein